MGILQIRMRSDQVEERVDMASPWTVQLQRDICRRALWRSRRCARLQDQFVKRQLILIEREDRFVET